MPLGKRDHTTSGRHLKPLLPTAESISGMTPFPAARPHRPSRRHHEGCRLDLRPRAISPAGAQAESAEDGRKQTHGHVVGTTFHQAVLSPMAPPSPSGSHVRNDGVPVPCASMCTGEVPLSCTAGYISSVRASSGASLFSNILPLYPDYPHPGVTEH